jgi:hypothetical protein
MQVVLRTLSAYDYVLQVMLAGKGVFELSE